MCASKTSTKSLGSILLAGALVFMVAPMGASHANFNKKRLDKRNGYLCEPNLLKRRISEATGRHRRFLEAMDSNSVSIFTNNSRCSGTFITPQCVLTAAHCFSAGKQPGIRAVDLQRKKFLNGGVGLQYPGYSYFDRDQKKIFHDDVGDTGIVKFRKPWPNFKPINVWYFKNTQDFWIYDWDESAPPVDDPRLLNRKFWSDFGTLGLTAYAPHSFKQPKVWSRCTDSHFGWAPKPRIARKTGASDFRKGVISFNGDSGPGMSGGAIYDLYGILGTLEGSSSSSLKTGKKLPKIPGTNYSIGNDEDYRPGYGASFVIIEPGQAKFIRQHCPGANLLRRAQLKGGRVAHTENRDEDGYIRSGSDPWMKLGFSARQTHVSREMKFGEKGLFVRRLQSQLRRLGYYSKAPNGKYDERTQAAVKRFQFDKRLKETGQADIWTLKLMEIMLE